MITESNYFSASSAQQYMSVSQLKIFLGCPARAIAETAKRKRPITIIPKIIENVKLSIIFMCGVGGFAVLGGVETGGISISTALLACAVLAGCGVMAAWGVKK